MSPAVARQREYTVMSYADDLGGLWELVDVQLWLYGSCH